MHLDSFGNKSTKSIRQFRGNKCKISRPFFYDDGFTSAVTNLQCAMKVEVCAGATSIHVANNFCLSKEFVAEISICLYVKMIVFVTNFEEKIKNRQKIYIFAKL
ncbi:hypothetical protein DEM91_05665 [Prevotella sp. TCVGH]|nr:hypothetical protein [Prevotella sp. TCVGH]